MNKIKNNKKLFAIILIISLLAVLLGSYAICKNSNKNETASKIEKQKKRQKKLKRVQAPHQQAHQVQIKANRHQQLRSLAQAPHQQTQAHQILLLSQRKNKKCG